MLYNYFGFQKLQINKFIQIKPVLIFLNIREYLTASIFVICARSIHGEQYILLRLNLPSLREMLARRLLQTISFKQAMTPIVLLYTWMEQGLRLRQCGDGDADVYDQI